MITIRAMKTVATPPTAPPITPALFVGTATHKDEYRVKLSAYSNFNKEKKTLMCIPAATKDELVTSEVPKLFTALA